MQEPVSIRPRAWGKRGDVELRLKLQYNRPRRGDSVLTSMARAGSTAGQTPLFSGECLSTVPDTLGDCCLA